jgi:hypothetical protein
VTGVSSSGGCASGGVASSGGAVGGRVGTQGGAPDAAPDAPAGGAPDAAPDTPAATPDVFTPFAQGKACSVDTDCALGNCVDGVCCNKAKSACAGCNACANSLTGADDGTCAPVSVGKDPHTTCADETATNPCGNDGTCDGKGVCRKVSTSHVCTPASCSSDGKTFTPASTCDGVGACNATAPQGCGAFECATTGCLQTCTSQADCVGANYCNLSVTPAVCAAKKVNGLPASQTYECATGVVADGVCCDKACSGCSACTLALNKQAAPSADGQCLAVVAGQAGHSTCTASPPCGLDGMCDGNGSCRFTAGGASCAANACTGSTLTTSACASSTHTCVPSSNLCPGSTACADATSCGTKKIQGAACSSTSDCAAGSCADNAAGTAKICCASACSNACQACKSDGSGCTTKNANVADSACGTTASCKTGLCTSGGVCQQASAGTNCGSSLFCTTTGQCTCQGGGTCPPPGLPCMAGAYSCSTGAQVCTPTVPLDSTHTCGSGPTCSDTTHFVGQSTCSSGSCVTPQAIGCSFGCNATAQPPACNTTCTGGTTACQGTCVNLATDWSARKYLQRGSRAPGFTRISRRCTGVTPRVVSCDSRSSDRLRPARFAGLHLTLSLGLSAIRIRSSPNTSIAGSLSTVAWPASKSMVPPPRRVPSESLT